MFQFKMLQMSSCLVKLKENYQLVTMKKHLIQLYLGMDFGKKGHSSLIGVVTIIASDSRKCLDCRDFSKICNFCQSWEVRREAEPELYQNFLDTYDSCINQKGSSGSMEASDVADCFMTSESKGKLRYTHDIW